MRIKILIIFILVAGLFGYLYTHPEVKLSGRDWISEHNPWETEDIPSVHHDTTTLIFQDTQTKTFNDNDLKVVVYDNTSQIIFDGYNDALSRIILKNIWTEQDYKIDLKTGTRLARVYESSQSIRFHGNQTTQFINVERMAFLKPLNVKTRDGTKPDKDNYLTLTHDKPVVIFIEIGQTGDGGLRDVSITFNGTTPKVMDAWVWPYNNVGLDLSSLDGSRIQLNERYSLGDLNEYRSGILAFQVERISKYTELEIIVQDSTGTENKKVKLDFI